MTKKILTIFTIFLFLLVANFSQVFAQVCNSGTLGGNTVGNCQMIYPCAGCQGYCGQFNQNNTCQCGPPSCSCTLGGGTGCRTSGGVPPTSTCTCIGGGPGASCTSDGNMCGTGIYVNQGTCSCTTPIGPGIASCSVSGTPIVYCPGTGGPTSVPPTNPPANPTTVPTAVPTVVVTSNSGGSIFTDPNDGSVIVSGNNCVKLGTAAVPLSIANASVKATKASNGVTTNGTIVGSNFQISGLIASATDYQISLALPTPAPNSTVDYVCGCPSGSNQYLCQYSGVAGNGSVNFFIKESSLANAWWQTYGGNVYARDQIQTQIPVATCEASGTCTSALIVGNGTNTSGFAVLGTNGVLKTTAEGSDAYVQSSGSRTTANGAYAVGVNPGQETYTYFTERLSLTPTTVTSLAELKAAILGQASDSTGIYRYTGGNLLIDKDSASIPLVLTGNKKVVVFVPGTITFSNSVGSAAPVLTDVPVGSFLMFASSGNIIVESTVGYSSANTNPLTSTPNLSGVFVSDGQIIIQSDGDTNVADRKFIGGGTFVGWDLSGVGNGLDLQRNFQNSTGFGSNSTSPAEAFVYRPDFVTNYPTDLKVAHYNWQEIAPQR